MQTQNQPIDQSQRCQFMQCIFNRVLTGTGWESAR